jgi:hypothetical protein
MKPNPAKQLAGYFGLTVEVITEMTYWAIIRYRGRIFLVSRTDLCGASKKLVATAH